MPLVDYATSNEEHQETHGLEAHPGCRNAVRQSVLGILDRSYVHRLPQQPPIVGQTLQNGLSLLRVGGSDAGFETTECVVDNISRDVLVGKLLFGVNTNRGVSRE